MKALKICCSRGFCRFGCNEDESGAPMQRMARFSTVFLFLSFTLLFSNLNLAQEDKRIRELESARGRLKKQTDPVGRAKAEIKISEILITLVSDAVRDDKKELMEKWLSEYTATIRDAHQTLSKTGRDAHRRPGGFKDLEIALRRQIRQLEDIGVNLTLEDREPVEKAKDQAQTIRDELLKALFGGQSAAIGQN